MILALAFLSGTAGLTYEVLWARHLTLLFGAGALAQTTVLALFLGGLSAGGARLGAAADRAPSAARFYARLEWAVAVLGLLAPLLLRAEGAWARWPALALLFAQAYLMGGTIPALCRTAGGEAQAGVGRVYAANSAGAVAGALAAAFALIPRLGLDGAFAAAAGLNALAALGARRLRDAAVPAAARGAADGAGPVLTPEQVRLAVFLSGFVALTYEIAWTRALALALGSSVYSFAEMLAAFIAGAAAGGWLASRGVLRRRDPARVLGLALAGAGAAVLLALPLYDFLPPAFIVLRAHFSAGLGDFYRFEAAKFALCLALMLAPAVCLGITLPLAARLVERRAGERGADVGGVFAANAAGNVLGAYAGWLLLPWLGVEGILRSGTTVFAAVGAAILWRAWPAPARRRGAVFAAGFALLTAYRAWLPRWDARLHGQGLFRAHKNLARFHFSDTPKLLADATVLFTRDDREATVTVTRFTGSPVVVSLKVNGKTDASNGPDMTTQILLGHLPLLLRPGARSALLVGWGSGVTAGALLTHPLERLDAVELVPAVAEGSRFFAAENHAAWDDPRLALHLEDAKTFLARDSRRYDAIVSEPSNPWMAGVGDLFSVEFYRRARARLAPGGVMVQWFHQYEMNDELFRMTLRTLRSSFPYVTLWNLQDSDVLLVGSDAPVAPDFAALEREARIPAVHDDLRRAGVRYPATLLSLQSSCAETAAAAAGDGPLNEERRPRLEYGAPLALFRNQQVTVVANNDDRFAAPPKPCLLLTGYLQARARPYSRLEYMDQVLYSRADREAPLVARLIADWRRRFPKDALAAQAQESMDALLKKLRR